MMHDPPHPYLRICAKARCTPDGVHDRFPGEPYQAAAWLLDRWQVFEPGVASGYSHIRLAALLEDFERRSPAVPSARD